MANPSYKLTGKHPLAYLGVEPTTPPQLVIESNIPKSSNTQFNIGTLWVVRNPETVWMLMNLDQGFADWIQLYPASGSGTQFFTANTGMGTEVGNNINILGIGVIDTFASGDNVFIGMGAGLDGQIPIAATGFSVEYANITPGAGITITNGANSITIAATGGQGVDSVPTNSGTAAPSAGVLNILGSNLISTSGSSDTVTVALDLALDGQIPIGSSAGATVMNTITQGSGISVTNGHNTITISNTGMGITTIDGDTGSVTGSTVTVKSGTSAQNCGSTVSFSGTSATMTLNVTGANSNTIMGKASGNGTLSGGNNTVLGGSSFTGATTAQYNTVLGGNALTANTTGNYNVVLGNSSLSTSIAGSTANVALGTFALQGATGTMTNNTILGYSAMVGAVAGGDNNICIGAASGANYAGAESNNICIGSPGVAAASNTLIVGSGTGTSTGQINKTTICGITGKTSASGIAVLVNSSDVLGTTTSSLRYKNNVEDMGSSSSRIYDLRPVTFNYKVDETHVDENDSKVIQYGLIAEEVLEIIPEMVVYNKDGEIDTLRYQHLAPMLLNELQKAMKRIEVLEAKLGDK